jgi:PAT family beta-lactamase induction signal transducer AmpG
VAQTGWFNFFLLCTLLALPGMALLLRVAPWREPANTGARSAKASE